MGSERVVIIGRADTSSMDKSRGDRDRVSRHLWVGGLPDDVGEGGIRDYFTRYVTSFFLQM